MIVPLLLCGAGIASAWAPANLASARVPLRNKLSMSSVEKNELDFGGVARQALASAAMFGLMANPAFSADYVPSSPPPDLSPQIIRTTPKLQQANAPEKWIYSKFLDEVEKDDVEKVTFSPDGKKAVGVNTDGDRFIVDIPNDPNLLSFLVQHKVEINVAPINANGGTPEATSLAIPSSELGKLLQVKYNHVNCIFSSRIFDHHILLFSDFRASRCPHGWNFLVSCSESAFPK